MFPREVIKILVYALGVLIVSLAVVMAGFALVQGTTEPGKTDPVAGALYGVGVGLLILLVIDAAILLVALGVNELARAEVQETSDDAFEEE